MVGGWRELLAERTEEAARLLGAIPGVTGLVVGGSVGRGEAWPLSDIDILPIRTPEAAAAIDRQQALLIDWWAASGRAQTLDVGWLAFGEEEVLAALAGGPSWAAGRMRDRRWFHGLDKAYGGYGTDAPDGLSADFARWATGVRFDPAVVAARLAVWREQAREAYQAGLAARAADDLPGATLALRTAAQALRLVLIEGWGERLGSMGREWTRFAAIAARHGGATTAARVAALAGADPAATWAVAPQVPHWLRARIDLAWEARQAIGEEVSEEESARDQIAAFRLHVTRHRPDLSGPWLGLPDPDLDARFAELGVLLAQYGAL